MLWYFNLFLHVSQNCNDPNSLCSSKEISSCYHTYFRYYYKKLFNLSGITDNIFPIVKSCLISLISGQKRYYIVRCWLQSSWFLIYHRHRYTLSSLITNGSYWSITFFTKYHISWDDPIDMCLMKKSLSFEITFSF